MKTTEAKEKKKRKAVRLKRKLTRRKMKNALGIDSHAQRVFGEMPPLPEEPKRGWKRQVTRARKKLTQAIARRAETYS